MGGFEARGGPPSDDVLVAIEDLTFRHARAATSALAGVSLAIARGEFVGVVGPGGAGKTTLAMCLNGLVPHLVRGDLSGRVRVAGHDPVTAGVRHLAPIVGMVFDNPEFQLSQASVAEEVALGLENLGVPASEMEARIGTALHAVGLDGFEDRSPLALSGGEQQRLAIAAVLVMRPEVLVLDEPTSNLDPAGKAAVFEILRRLNRSEGLTVIAIEHEVELLAEHADRIVALVAGRVVRQGTPGAVFGDVPVMKTLGIRVPQVTELAWALAQDAGGTGPGATRLPVTIDEAVRWLATRS